MKSQSSRKYPATAADASAPRTRSFGTRSFGTRSSGARTAFLILLALATILIHGFHPFSEDGGLYAAGVEYKLDPSLFPHFTAFVTEHLRFSLFAPAVALLVRLTRLPLSAALLLLALLAAFATMASARALLRRCALDDRAQFAGLALLAAGWTLPIAGTSLYLMDPYTTARSLTMPLSLLAMAFALDPWPSLPLAGILRHPALRCAVCLLVAAAFHPLMAGYALLFVTALRATRSPRPLAAWSILSTATLLLCLAARLLAPAESPAETIAVISRYYWFLSQWHWYERLGLLGPPVMLALVLRSRLGAPGTRLRTLALTGILLAVLCSLCALLFTHEASPTHAIARLQPLREFLLIYAVMLLLLGATIADACRQAALRTRGPLRLCLHALPALSVIAMAFGLFAAARGTYPASPHIEFPGQPTNAQNTWVQAFLWARENTPPDALFALDARYVNTPGEDAQTFRAISLRSALPDYSKDGGEASITPSIAPTWLAGAKAQADLSRLNDPERDRRLAPFSATWMILQASAQTAHPCPYNNGTIKVCRLQFFEALG